MSGLRILQEVDVNRGDAYSVLCRRLNELRGLGYESLLSRVGRPTTTESIQVNGEPVVIDVGVVWADRKLGKLGVWATASGPSTWMMERLDESFVIGPGTSSSG